MTNLLPANAPAGTIGKWADLGNRRKKFSAMKIVAIGTFAGDKVYIDELVGGTPGHGANSPFPPQADTGTFIQIGAIAPGDPPLVLLEPCEYVRARCGAFTGGTTVKFCGIELQE